LDFLLTFGCSSTEKSLDWIQSTQKFHHFFNYKNCIKISYWISIEKQALAWLNSPC
jgi:hypothetical protein